MALTDVEIQPRRVILDTDLAMGEGANIDDGFALALAHADPALQLDMITTVHGNTDVESATILTELLATQLGIDLLNTPIYRGAATPLIHTNQKRRPSPHVLAIRDAAPSTSARLYAPMAIVQHVLANPGEITIIAIGPLTNIALALLLEPRISTQLKELVIMGGCFYGHTGLRSKPGETNVFTDPEAAQAILRSGIPQRWVGLDCTLRVQLGIDQMNALEASSSPFSAFAGKAAKAYLDVLAARWPGRPPPDSCALHDALAVAVVSRPEFCVFKKVAASVITGEGEARGVMITDRLEGVNPPEPNCNIAIDVNVKAFKHHFLCLIQTL
ncbi:inosine-uridine preferring nucleoside hydrolase domain-containing protein [Sarocladium implicatum]|nr:inosine-uridine preferring nucleoside hydrolase domain-containing protein [Sarocladium implicatum]